MEPTDQLLNREVSFSRDAACLFVITLWGKNDYLEARLFLPAVGVESKMHSVTLQHTNHYTTVIYSTTIVQ